MMFALVSRESELRVSSSACAGVARGPTSVVELGRLGADSAREAQARTEMIEGERIMMNISRDIPKASKSIQVMLVVARRPKLIKGELWPAFM